jgi:glycosyltransferase involved in cell wall biosynthesis
MRSDSTYLRVLLVAARYFPYIGGLETHVYEVGRRLARAGVDVSVLTTDPTGRMPRTEEIEGTHVRRVRAWPRRKDYYFAPEIYPIIAQERWDLIHCQGYHTLVPPLAMAAALRAGVPYVLTFHSGGDSSRFRKAFRRAQCAALRPLLARAERLIGVSRFEAEFFRERLRLPRDRFVVIPNGAQHLPELRDLPTEPTNGKLIVSVGRLERYKGHQRVIAALPKVLEHEPNVRLLIVGVGPYETALRAQARSLGVADRVEIRGMPPGDTRGMAEVFARASLVTLLSEHEGQGLAALEALMLRRPVLVAATTALQELAQSGLARGVAVESTPDDVATAVLDQLREPMLPADVALPTWDSSMTALLHLYADVHRRPACVS